MRLFIIAPESGDFAIFSGPKIELCSKTPFSWHLQIREICNFETAVSDLKVKNR
jgi:hypothetical protein